MALSQNINISNINSIIYDYDSIVKDIFNLNDALISLEPFRPPMMDDETKFLKEDIADIKSIIESTTDPLEIRNIIELLNELFGKFLNLSDVFIGGASDENRNQHLEHFSLEGIDVYINNFGRSGQLANSNVKNIANTVIEQKIKQSIDAISSGIRKIKSVGLGNCLKDFKIIINSISEQPGLGGAFNPNQDSHILYIMPGNSKEDSEYSFIHEFGHKFYFLNLSPGARNYWVDELNKTKVEIKDYSDFMKEIVIPILDQKYIDSGEEIDLEDIEEEIKKIMSKHKPTLKLRKFQLFLNNLPRPVTPLVISYGLENFDRIFGNNVALLEDISNYATVHPHETFAEAFALFVTKPNSLGNYTRAFFKKVCETAGTKFKLAQIIKKYNIK